MRRVHPISAMQQAFLSVTLGLISAAAWYLLASVRTRSGHSSTHAFTLFFLAIFGTSIASFWITYDLRTGIESERWPEEQISRFRAVFSSTLAWSAYSAVIIAAFLFLFFDFISHNYHLGPGYGLLLLSQNYSQLQMAARRPQTGTPLQQIDWRSASRITSDHWGEHR